MLYWLYEHFKSSDSLMSKLTHVFQYQTFRGVAACLIAFGLSLMLGNRVIRKLISLKVGQPIRTAEEVNKLFELHGAKAGTPTMGGILIIGALLIACLLCCRMENPLLWITLYVTLGLGALGFVDDYLKVSKKNSKGVSARGKLIVQWTVGLTAGYALYNLPGHEDFFSKLQLPFFKNFELNMGLFTVLFVAVVIVGCSNAVNLTDGLDGLASGCTITVGLAYAIFCYLCGNKIAAEYLNIEHSPLVGGLAPVALGLVGAAIGFLWFNAHPARVFMGDTGSMAIGGCIAMLAIASKQEIVLVIVGGVCVRAALSVMMQVSYFKYTKKKYGAGRRIFKMSPLHHHYQKLGYHESKIVTRFWIVGIMLAIVSIVTLKLR